jgi:hypothetical protein
MIYLILFNNCQENEPTKSTEVYNYFPLIINENLRFNYARTFHSPWDTKYDDCILTWDIIQEKQVEDSTIYTVEEKINGNRMVLRVVDDPNNFHIDTTLTEVNRNHMFTIIEYKDSLKFIRDIPFAESPPLNDLFLKVKYEDNENEELVLWFSELFTIHLVLNKGISLIKANTPHSNNWDEYELRRIYD